MLAGLAGQRGGPWLRPLPEQVRGLVGSQLATQLLDGGVRQRIKAAPVGLPALEGGPVVRIDGQPGLEVRIIEGGLRLLAELRKPVQRLGIGAAAGIGGPGWGGVQSCE